MTCCNTEQQAGEETDDRGTEEGPPEATLEPTHTISAIEMSSAHTGINRHSPVLLL
jgi:hypothetical protein